jgi:sodium/potassium-transporting ATPase subunit alpha
MILLDDNFSSTVHGIEEGRLIFQNLKKSVRYTVTHTMPEVWAQLLAIAIPMPQALGVILILVVDLGFELFVALSFAWDVSENRTGLMKLPPRKPVTEASYERLKRIQKADMEDMKRIKGDKYASEEGEHSHHERPSVWRRIFTSRFWKESFEKNDNDILVDVDCLSYSYLEAGTIETIFCFISFFFAIWWYSGKTVTPSVLLQTNGGSISWGVSGSTWNATDKNGNPIDNASQVILLAIGQSAFYISLMIQQLFNAFACKARLAYPFGAYMFSNKMTFILGACGAVFCLLLVYIPPINFIFGTDYRLSPLSWLVGMAGGVVLFFYNVLRIAVKKARKFYTYFLA